MNRAIVLHAALPGQWTPAREHAALSRLPYAKRLELERAAPSDRLASLCGIVLAGHAIARLRGAGAEDLRIEFPQGRKPRVHGGPDFSISHCEGRVACAATTSSTVGLDVERADPSGATGWIERWTATEATLKAAGMGLRSSSRVRIDGASASVDGHEDRYVLAPLELAPGYVACLACNAAPDALEVVEADELL
jgi:4'-phosphopantetheinyl transferase